MGSNADELRPSLTGEWIDDLRRSTVRTEASLCVPVVIHLTASRFFGAPERQMLELGRELRPSYRSVYIMFSEEGGCADFAAETQAAGFEVYVLKRDHPRLVAASRELTKIVKGIGASVICPHCYKADILGLRTARKLRIPIVCVSHGWTGESLRVRLYDRLDRLVLRWMDKVVCVSDGQATKVKRYGVPSEKVLVIHDAVRPERFSNPNDQYRTQLEEYFSKPTELIVGAAGRLSPEKGFSVFIDAAVQVATRCPTVNFAIFGEGALRDQLQRQIDSLGLSPRCRLVGFRKDFHRFLPQLDLFVQSSFTEGLPNVLLESAVAGVPVVATDVGGTAEIVEDGVTGYLVPSGDASALANRIIGVLSDGADRVHKALASQDRAKQLFTFEKQAESYERLFAQLLPGSHQV